MEANLIASPMKLKLQVEEFEIVGLDQMLRLTMFAQVNGQQKFELELWKKNSTPSSEDFVNQLVGWAPWLLPLCLIFKSHWLRRIMPEAWPGKIKSVAGQLQAKELKLLAESPALTFTALALTQNELEARN